MEPFYFSAGERKLFGTYHPPRSHVRDEAVLVCPPLFGEYMRSHGCLRRLALSLAANGLHVLRFDYSGTGDSSETFTECSPELWCADIRSALHELQAISGVRRCRLLAVRFGAALALMATENRKDLERIALWDPLVNGKEYISQLQATHARLLAAHDAPRTEDSPLPTEGELVGFEVTDRLVDDVSSVRLPDWAAISSSRSSPLVIVASQDSLANEELATQGDSHGVEIRRVEFDCDWGTYKESVLFPHAIIDALIEGVS